MKNLIGPFALATLMGTVMVVGVWSIALSLGVDFTVSTLGMAIPAGAFVVFSAVGGVGALLVSTSLLKSTTPRKTGQIVGWLVLLASMTTPLSGTTDLMAIVAINSTHFAIGVPLLIAMRKHLPEKN